MEAEHLLNQPGKVTDLSSLLLCPGPHRLAVKLSAVYVNFLGSPGSPYCPPLSPFPSLNPQPDPCCPHQMGEVLAHDLNAVTFPVGTRPTGPSWTLDYEEGEGVPGPYWPCSPTISFLVLLSLLV